jgi:hypothetical protein
MYDADDRARGYVEVLNRRHDTERFPMSLTTRCQHRPRLFASGPADRYAQELKAHARAFPEV